MTLALQKQKGNKHDAKVRVAYLWIEGETFTALGSMISCCLEQLHLHQIRSSYCPVTSFREFEALISF